MTLITTFLNGDPRLGRVTHHEVGCCVDAAGNFDMSICRINVTQSIIQGGLVLGTLQDLPKKARWGTQSEHLAEQLAGE